MALPGIRAVPGRAGVAAALLLFERLPDRLFAPLASDNRRRYWDILCQLHARRFGPDAPLPPSHGYTTREIIADIEEELLCQDTWESEEGEAPETPVGIRAAGVFNRLVEAGWYRVEKHGLGRRVSMRPTVSQFLSMLVSFAETGPVFVSAEIRSVAANIKMVASGEGSGDSLSVAAKQARELMERIRNTGTNVRDIMESLGADIPTSEYVQRFFSDYIEGVFIGDYRELRTKNHPLARRAQIIESVEEIYSSSAQRDRLIAWYESKHCAGDGARAERLFQRDIDRIFELKKIDEYLDRLDEEIRRANKRALVFLDYRLRSLRPVDKLVQQAVARLISSGRPGMNDPFAPLELIGGERLAEPRKTVERPVPEAIVRRVPTEAEIARSRIMLRARDARAITAPKLAAFIRHQLAGGSEIQSRAMTLKGVADVRAYQALGAAAAAMGSGSRHLQMTARALVRGAEVVLSGGAEEDHPFITGKPFVVEAHKRRAAVKGDT